MAMASIKFTPVKCSVIGAIEDGWSIVSDLYDEVSESVENQRDHPGIAATSRFQTMEETCDSLSEVNDGKPDWSSELETAMNEKMDDVSYTENRKRGLSRSDRRNNAVNAIDAAINELRAWAEARDATAEKNEELRDLIDEANELADQLEEQKDTLDGLEFPGMRG